MFVSKFAMALATALMPAAGSAQTTIAAPNPTPNEIVNLSIDEAVALGLSRSFRVQRSVRNEDMSETRVDNSKAQLRPRFDLNGTASQDQRYSQFAGEAYKFDQAKPAFYTNANASASLPLDISGVTNRNIKQSKLQHQSSEIELAQASIDVATDIRSQYVSTLRAQEQVRAEEQYVAVIEELLGKARAQQPSVVAFLQTERDNAVQQLEGSKTNRDLSMSSLRQGLRLPRDTRLNLTNGLAKPQALPSADTLLSIAGRSRNDLKQAQVRLEQARLSRRQAMDSRLPRLGVTAYAVQGLTGRTPFFGDRDTGRSLNTGIAVTFNVPVLQYDGGVLRNNRRIADVQAEQAVADAAEALERAENEIQQVMIGLDRAHQRLASLPDADKARESLDQVEGQLLRATATDAPGVIAQVTNARQNWRSAIVARNDALTDYYSNFFRLQRAVGAEDIPVY
jgi:outer membrane protein TolC